MSIREKWDRRYREASGLLAEPCRLLVEFAHLLPAEGEALDLAAGLGGNALFLSRRGLVTSAWDISGVAMRQLADTAERQGLPLGTQVRDLATQPPPADSFDVITVSRFLDRTLCPYITAALRQGGLLYYQTYTADRVAGAGGPNNPDFLLARNELLRLFCELELVYYREEGGIGDTRQGMRNEAQLIARKVSAG